MDPNATPDSFTGFVSWVDLLVHIDQDKPLYYHAPLDYRPVLVTVRAYRNGKIRVYPPTRDADPFTADEGHLDRFKRRSQP